MSDKAMNHWRAIEEEKLRERVRELESALDQAANEYIAALGAANGWTQDAVNQQVTSWLEKAESSLCRGSSSEPHSRSGVAPCPDTTMKALEGKK